MARMAFFTVEKLGPKQSLTPEGFLLCEEVPVARAGMMIYGPDETPIEAGPEGLVKIFRDPEDIFRPETLASAQGKSVTNDHPDDDVTPATWLEKTNGIVLNPRPGLGVQDDLLFADLLITTPLGIKAVQDGKVEVSLGYDADYEETGPGTGRQRNIIINHVALVENGRCGSRCAIRDQNSINKEAIMPAPKSKMLDRLMKAFKAKDAAEVEKLAAEMHDEELPEAAEKGDVHVHVHAGGGSEGGNLTSGDEGAAAEEGARAKFTDDMLQEHVDRNEAEHAEMKARIEALEGLVAKISGGEAGEAEDAENEEMKAELRDEAPEGMAEQATKAKDSAYLVDSFKDTVAAAEILVPGIQIPTVDRAAKPGATMKKLCNFRRSALDLAYSQPATRGVLDELLSGKSLDTKMMTCDAVRTLFKSAVAIRKNMNNASGKGRVADERQAPKGPMTLSELNKRNAARYADK